MSVLGIEITDREPINGYEACTPTRRTVDPLRELATQVWIKRDLILAEGELTGVLEYARLQRGAEIATTLEYMSYTDCACAPDGEACPVCAAKMDAWLYLQNDELEFIR